MQKFIRTRYVSVKCFPLCQCEMYYRVLQYVVVCETHIVLNLVLQHTATHCNTLQHTATHCNTL